MDLSVVVLLFFCVYLAPSVIALARRHRQAAAIVTIDVLLGWTMLAWLVALGMALSPNRRWKVPFAPRSADPNDPVAATALDAELWHVYYVLNDLSTLPEPIGSDALLTRYRERYRQLWDRYAATGAVAQPAPRAPRPTAHPVVTAARPAAPSAPQPEPRAVAVAPPRPSLKELGRRLLADHAIVIISEVGAFLLIIATILFELYGPREMAGGVRLAAVAVLNASFAVAAALCHRRARMRLVATSYTVIAALMWPLTLIAAYQYVLRDAAHVDAITALSMGATACAVAYGAVAHGLRSRGYATMSLAALAVAGVSAAVASNAGPRAIPAAAAYALLCWLLARSVSSPFALPATIAGHAASAAGVIAAIAAAATEGVAGAPPHFVHLPAALLLVAGAYAVRHRLNRDDLALVATAALLSLLPVCVVMTLGLGVAGVAPAVVAVGLLAAAGSHGRLPDLHLGAIVVSRSNVALAFAAVAAVECIAAGALPVPGGAVQLAVVVAASVGGLLIAGRHRTALWLATGLACTAFQLVAQQVDFSPPASFPIFLPVGLGAELVAVATLGLARRDRTMLVPAILLLAASVVSAGRARGWSADHQAMALMGVSLITAIAAWRQPVLARGGAEVLGGGGNILAWIAATAAVGAALFSVSDPALQVVLLGSATALSLLLALTLGSPWWLLTSVAALAAQVATHGTEIGVAGQAPSYVPITLGLLLVSLLVTAVVQRNRWIAVAANLALAVATLTSANMLGWSVEACSLALVGVAAAAAATLRLIPAQVASAAEAGRFGLSNPLAWLAVSEAVGAAGFAVASPAVQLAVVTAAAVCGLVCALETASPWWLSAGVAALLAQTLVHANDIAVVSRVPVFVPAGLGLVLVGIVVVAAVQREWRLVIPGNLCLTATVLTANAIVGGGSTGVAAELVLLGATASLCAPLVGSPRMRAFLRLGAGARLAASAVIFVDPAWAHAVLVLGASAAAVHLAVSAKRSPWLYLAGGLFEYGWYLAASAITGGLVDPQGIATAFSPVPVVLGVAAAVVAMRTSRRGLQAWAVPPLVFACVTGIAVAGVAGATQSWSLLAWLLLVDATMIYAAACRFETPAALVGAAGALLAGALIALLLATGAPLITFTLGLASLAWVTRLAGRIRSGASDAWTTAHLRTGVGLAATALLVTAAKGSETIAAHSPVPLVDLAVSLSLATMVWAGLSASRPAGERYVAVLMAGLAVDWVPVFLGWHEPLAYLLVPAITSSVCGVLLRHDVRAGAPRLLADALVAVGAGGALATGGIEIIASGDTSTYTAWLLLQGIVALGGGIVARHRLLALLGSAAVAASALRSLLVAVQAVPLYAVFGGAALLLLAVATLLAAARPQIGEMRHSLRRTWNGWD